jgi:N-formylglutamate deformylase
MELHEIVRGDSPLVIDIPHAGTHVPGAILDRLTATARSCPDTDWHVEKLYAFAPALGATMVIATHSRYVVDLNRDPSGRPLYPGADNTETCPLRTFADEPIYVRGGEPDAAEIAQRIEAFHAPYHASLEAEVERVRARHGYVVLLDGHSIRSRLPRFFTGRLPDLNLGTARGTSCAAGLQAVTESVLGSAAGFTSVFNGRFTGGYVTRHYGMPSRGAHALQLEMAQVCYMGEAPPYAWSVDRAGPLSTVLRRLVAALLAWPPQGSAP